MWLDVDGYVRWSLCPRWWRIAIVVGWVAFAVLLCLLQVRARPV